MSFRTHHRQRVLASACITAALGLGMVLGAHPVRAATAQRAGSATPTYTLRKISNLVGYGLTLDGNAYGYNLSTVVAEVVTPAGKVITLTTPRGVQSMATAGYGHYYAGTTTTAVRWTLTGTSSSVQTLKSAAGSSPMAEGVDAAGAVVGQSDGQPVLWKAGSTAVTKLPLAAGYVGGEATSISANGTIIAGEVTTTAEFGERAATWLRSSSGGYVIHLLPGTGTGTDAEAINSAGIEVGGQLFNAGQAYEWLPESSHTFEAVDLGGPAGAGCIATAIDNATTPAIIGDCNSTTSYAWIYRGHQTLTDLQPVIAKADPGITATSAIGTDDAGQLLIEADGAVFADYVLTPTST